MQLLLYDLRKEQNKLTQEDMAKYLGISTKSYRDKEKGKQEFTQDEMFKLAKFFNKPIDKIFLPRKFQIGTENFAIWKEKL